MAVSLLGSTIFAGATVAQGRESSRGLARSVSASPVNDDPDFWSTYEEFVDFARSIHDAADCGNTARGHATPSEVQSCISVALLVYNNATDSHVTIATLTLCNANAIAPEVCAALGVSSNQPLGRFSPTGDPDTDQHILDLLTDAAFCGTVLVGNTSGLGDCGFGFADAIGVYGSQVPALLELLRGSPGSTLTSRLGHAAAFASCPQTTDGDIRRAPDGTTYIYQNYSLHWIPDNETFNNNHYN
jgi:hypothetical protein